MTSLKSRFLALLRWSERYTKTDMVYLTKGGFWLTTDYLLQAGSGFLLAIVLANMVSKGDFGTYQFVISAATIIGTFTLSGYAAALARASAAGEAGALPYAFRAQLAWNAFIAVAGGALAAFYFLQGDTSLGLAFIFVGALLPFLTGFSLYANFLIGKQDFRALALLGIWRKILPFAAVISTISLTSNPAFLVLAYFSGHTVSAMLAYRGVCRKYPEPRQEHPEITRYAKHLSVMNILTTVARNIDKIAVWYFLGAIPLAVYTLALTPVGFLQALLSHTSTLALPKFTKRGVSELKTELPKKMPLYYAFVALIALTYLVAAPLFFRLVFPAYPEAIVFSQLLVLALFTSPRALLVQVFTAHEKKREQYIVSIATFLTKLCAFGVLVPIYGIYGAVAAVLVSELAIAVIQVSLFTRLRGAER
jgi:O-antigen/teichoic acid export membrane protein